MDALARAAAVLLQLGLAGAAAADAAGQAAHHRVLLVQARQPVTELRQLDLQLAVPALRALREDVEDQHRPIDDLQIGEVRDRVRLDRVQVGIEDQHVGVELHRPDQHLFQLAAPDQVFRIGLGTALFEDAHHAHARRAAQLLELVDLPLRAGGRQAGRAAGDARRAADVDHDQQRAIALVGHDHRGRDAIELLFQGLDQRRRIQRAAEERLGRQQVPGLPALDRRQQVGDVEVGRAAVGPDADRRDQVQAQQRQVDEVVARQRLVAQVRVHQPQAAEAPATGADAAKLGQVDARGVADEHVLDLAAPPDQDPDLALDLPRDLTQVRGKLGRRDLRGPEPPAVDALQRMLLARLEPGDIAADDVQGGEVSTAPPGARCRDILRPWFSL